MGRYEIYQKYKQYKRNVDNSSMDELCNKPDNAFELQVQQLFLRDYMTDNKDLKRILLYHAIGSGKSCSAIVMSEAFLSLNPENHITFILPARLRTNMYDELFSACSGYKYVSEEDYKIYMNPNTSNHVKTKIKSKFMANVKAKYTILSFEKFRIDSLAHKQNIKNYLKNFSKNNMIIVDETHNLFTTGYDEKAYKKMDETGIIEKPVKGMNAILMKLLSKFCHNSTKMVFMTATPVFDNIEQLIELTKIVNPQAKLSDKPKISDIVEQLRGMVSYFPGTSKNAYPTYEYQIHNIPMSQDQDEQINEITHENKQYFTDAFMAKQRMFSLSIAAYDEFNGINELKDISPKIDFLTKFIKRNVGKHVVYSNFIEYGVKVVQKVLQEQGWKSLNEVKDSPDLWEQHKFKVYAIWDGHTNDAEKQFIKSVSNNVDNLFGNKIRVIIGSPSIREGVTVKHAQHIHILDPVWNMSAKLQVEGRAIRFCSHSDIDEQRDRPLKRHVDIHTYNLIPRENGMVKRTSDQIIASIMEKKHKQVSIAENALKKVAIDYHLFKKMYSEKTYSRSPRNPGSAKSEISVEKDDVIAKMKEKKPANSCPSKRRPNQLGQCKENQYKKRNLQGHMCCYKYTKRQLNERNNNT